MFFVCNVFFCIVVWASYIDFHRFQTYSGPSFGEFFGYALEIVHKCTFMMWHLRTKTNCSWSSPQDAMFALATNLWKLLVVCLNWLRKSCKKLIQKKNSCPIQWRQGMFTDISELMLFSVRFTTPISYQNYLKNMLEFFQNLLKIVQKSIQNGVLEGSWAVGGPFREARRPRDWFFMDFGVIWGAILGHIWEVKSIKIIKKSILSDSKSLKTLNTLLDGFQHWFFIDFGAISELFEGDFWDGFGGSPTRAR